jgi:hypothetical protein
MKKIIPIICLIIISISCEKEVQYNLDTQIEVLLLDKSGNNLLKPSNPAAYNVNDIKLYYVEGNSINEVFYSNLDYPRNYMILDELDYRIRIFPNASKKEDFPVTLIKWNETDMDTIKCEFSRTENSLICRKVWYNGKLMWDNIGVERFFEIVK